MVRFPLHERTTRTDKVEFVDGTTSDYKPPVNTLDPRYAACTEHQVGCDCREADLREDIVDAKAELDVLRAAIREIVGGHPTFVETVDGERPGCECTGCQIVRRDHTITITDVVA